MQPLHTLTHTDHLRVVAFDLDDTLLTHGALTRDAYNALFALKDAGFMLVAATGRPANWGAVIAKQWPIAACVVENGGLAFYVENGRVLTWDPLSRSARHAHTERLQRLVHEVAGTFPTLALADDSSGRITDVAWDVREYAAVPDDQVEALDAFLRARGALTTRSSVHVHATFAACTKATGLTHIAEARLGLDANAAQAGMLFVGDSGNDAPCFAHFHTTVAVANVAQHLASLPIKPGYVTQASAGAGFCELAAHLLANKPR